LRRLLPGLASPEIRGSDAAVRYLLRALFGLPDVRSEVFVPQEFLRSGLGPVALKDCALASDAVKVHPVRELLAGVDRFHLTTWLDPRGDMPFTLRLRANFASTLYPVAGVAHGLSSHVLLYDWFLRVLLADPFPCDTLVCTSRACRTAFWLIMERVTDQFNRRFGTRLTYRGRTDLIPLCVDTDELCPRDKLEARRKLGLPVRSFVMIFLGRLSLMDKADLFAFVRVLQRLVEEFPKRGILLLLAGTERGPFVEALKKYAGALGVEPNVRAVCDVSDETRNDLLAAGDVFVSPADAITESFGLTPIEAMACGVPQVVADWDGYRDTVVHGETGFLVPSYWTNCSDDLSKTGPVFGWAFDHLAVAQSVAVDPAALARYLRCLIENEPLRKEMGDRARRRATKLYSLRAVMSQYQELWAELSRVARSVCSSPRRGFFEEPAYWECFKHHASTQINDSTLLQLTHQGVQIVDSGQPLLPAHPDLANFPILEENLLRELLKHFRGAWHGSDRADHEGLLLGEVAGRMGKNADQNRVKRHVMWLVKYGFVEPVFGPTNGLSMGTTPGKAAEVVDRE
jgi:glycosyltransferase involved in cell wall biosynthesis